MLLMSSVVGMMAEDREPAIELLKQHDAGEFVSERHLAEREHQVRGVACFGGEPVGRTNRKDESLCPPHLVRFQHFRELFGSELPAACVEEHEGGSGFCSVHQLQQRGFSREFNAF